MANDLLGVALEAWLLAGVLALTNYALWFARVSLGIGGLALLAVVIMALPGGLDPIHTPLGVGPSGSNFTLSPDALWLAGFGLPAAIFAAWLGTPAQGKRTWLFGVAASLLGALGVFGFQDAVSFLVAWEIMSLGGAIMILGEGLAPDKGRPVLFMLSLLEAGSVALILAFLLLARQTGGLSFSEFAAAGRGMSEGEQLFVGLLLLIGFGAKLGLLPFFEWFPGAYGTGSGATGALLSGIVLNAAFFGLGRGLTEWLPISDASTVSIPGVALVALGVVSAILSALYAFQREDWRELLSLSSAENASVAVSLLGVALMFRQDGLLDLAGLAWTIALIHLGGHALAKGTMFLAADGVYRAAGDYMLAQRGILTGGPWIFGLGSLFAAMSLAAMPPQAGFVSEWYLFQVFFQGFHLHSLASRLAAALAGAGLALTAAIALAIFVKLFGIGLLGRRKQGLTPTPFATSAAVGMLGSLVLAFAVGMPIWLNNLAPVSPLFDSDAPSKMADGWLLVPLTVDFAFISPSKLVIAMPLLALLPVTLVLLSIRRRPRIAAVWYGGGDQNPERTATTALTFSNALRTFYSFIYRPVIETEREALQDVNGKPYFTRRLVFTHDVAPIFGPYLFAPLERLVVRVAKDLRIIQSGHLNFYLSLIGALLILILLAALF